MNTKSYWKMVFRTAWHSAWKRVEITALILVFIFALAFAFLTGLLSIFGVVTFQFFKENALANFLTAITQITCSLGLFIILFSILIYKTPADIHNKNIKRIEELDPDDPFEFILKPPYRLEKGIVWVGIDIFNNSTYSTNCSVSVQTKKMKKSSVLARLSNNIESRNFEITRTTNLPFYFACSGKEWPNAVLNTIDDAERIIYPGSHELLITINGENTNGKPISHSESFILIFEGNDKIVLTKKIKLETE